MSTPGRQRRSQAARERIERLKEQVQAASHVCRGTLAKRTTVCGKPNCRCAQDPKHRHGPYYEWSRWENGRLTSRRLSPEQAAFVRDAIASYRAIRKLLRAWETETVKIMRATFPRNHLRHKDL